MKPAFGTSSAIEGKINLLRGLDLDRNALGEKLKCIVSSEKRSDTHQILKNACEMAIHKWGFEVRLVSLLDKSVI